MFMSGSGQKLRTNMAKQTKDQTEQGILKVNEVPQQVLLSGHI